MEGHYVVAKAFQLEKQQAIARTLVTAPPATAPVPKADSASYQSSLERVKLPHFSDKQSDWECFKDKFTSLILADKSISSDIKFQRLLNCLEADAAEKLRGISPIGANFDSAWDTLLCRNDNKFLRLSVQMQSLLCYPAVTSESASQLSKLLNAVNVSRNVFKALKHPVAQWDDLFVHLLNSRLPHTTRLDWLRKVETDDADFPTFEQIKTILEDRIRTLVMLQTDYKDGSPKCTDSSKSGSISRTSAKGTGTKAKQSSVNIASSSVSQPSRKLKYLVCNSDHPIYSCKTFGKDPARNDRKLVPSENG